MLVSFQYNDIHPLKRIQMTNNIAIRALTYSDAYTKDNDSNDERLLEDKEIEKLIVILKQLVNIPFMDEQRERDVFVASILLVEKALSMLLPRDLLTTIHDEEKGVSFEEVSILEKRMTPILNNMINVPIVPEFLETRIITTVLGSILNGLRRGSRIDF